MNKLLKLGFVVLLGLGAAALLVKLLHGHDIAVLNPRGLIAFKERSLMITATLLMLIVVIPVFILTFVISWRYRAGNTKAKYAPDWDHHRVLEFTWWAVPTAIIVGLAVITWQSSHELDPYKPLASDKKPITIQVVALQWKWLFIYPEQHIASVNMVEFPEGTPVNFEITSDAPMNSFWIPQLGGQIYAMSGMTTHLHLMADSPGSFDGSSANLSGAGFAGMKFTAKSVPRAEFDVWAKSVERSPRHLDHGVYQALAKPSQNNPPSYYSSVTEGLYDDVVMNYMTPMPGMVTQ